MVIPPACARVFIAPIGFNYARALQPAERRIQRRLFQLHLSVSHLLHVLADDIAVAVSMNQLRKDDCIRISAKDIRRIQHFITSVFIYSITIYLTCQCISIKQFIHSH